MRNKRKKIGLNEKRVCFSVYPASCAQIHRFHMETSRPRVCFNWCTLTLVAIIDNCMRLTHNGNEIRKFVPLKSFLSRFFYDLISLSLSLTRARTAWARGSIFNFIVHSLDFIWHVFYSVTTFFIAFFRWFNFMHLIRFLVRVSQKIHMYSISQYFTLYRTLAKFGNTIFFFEI